MIKNILRNFGIDVVRYPDREMKAMFRLLSWHKINKVLDVGANNGWYANYLRSIGYQHDIISFEPLNGPYRMVAALAAKDSQRHKAVHCALGEFDGTTSIRVSKNLVSSSILEPTVTLNALVPETQTIEMQEIKVQRLDTIFDQYCHREKDRVFLKLDVQGYEKYVLEGAQESMKVIHGLQLETAFVELYSSEMLFQEMMNNIQAQGFELKLILPGFYDDKEGRMLEADCVFMRNTSTLQ